ncbi:uncharacterized protein [Acropora muricata]|uniref:uncharacterized protein isoform X2 n=1 Tax=Acropora muricata TaxID=159855 RepID=UPI0034E3DEE5
MSNQGTSEQPRNGPKCIEIPRGWNRILENGSILYISPNNSRLRSLDHVIEYLTTEGTCKCGLECPLFAQKVFNFDARIPSKPLLSGSNSEPSNSTCKHCVNDNSDVPDTKQSVDTAAKQLNDVTPQGAGQKRGPGRPRNPSSKTRRVGIRKPDLDRPMSPLHNLPLPVPSSVLNSPVQSVPTNISVEQRPLPSFATIVSSSKLFNPGAGLGSNNVLCTSVVTTAVNSSALTTTTLHSSKVTIINNSVAVGASSPSTKPAVITSSGSIFTAASSTSGPVLNVATGSQSKTGTVTVSAQLPSRDPVATKSSSSLSPAGKTSPLSDLQAIGQVQAKTAVSSALTSVVSTSTATIPVAKQEVKPVSGVSKVLPVKVTPKASTARANRSSRPYSARKTVAATLKAEAAAAAAAAATTNAKVPNSAGVTRTAFDHSFRQPQGMLTTGIGTSTVKSSTRTITKPSAQALPASTVGTSTTTVQAPALFHSVLKDAMVKEQGHLSRDVSSTNAPTPAVSHTGAIHAARVTQTGSDSTRSRPGNVKETLQSTAALVQGVHVPAAVPQQLQVHRPQPLGVGQALVNTTGGVYTAVSLASNPVQQQTVQSAVVAQTAAHVIPSSAGVYGQAQNAAASTQIQALQLNSSQGQGGMFFQGSGNQIFQMNVDSNQLKGAYQVHGALYQAPIAATLFTAANANKTASTNTPGPVPHAIYPTNPYMVGIVMPTAMTQSVSNQAAQSVTTTTTSPSATAAGAAAAAASVASYPYVTQNPAIAAAFESFVPIAPAAAPRFSQTLAHLASAYSPFLPRGPVQGNTPVQFAAQRMVPMGAMQSQAGGNGQMGPAILNLADYTVKYPLNTVKPGSFASQAAASTSTVVSSNTHPQTAVVAAMPCVAFGQINNPRFPFSVNFAMPATSANPQSTPSVTPPSCAPASSATTSQQYTPGSTSESQGGGAVLSYVSMPLPFGTNPSGASQLQTSHNLLTGSAFSPPSSHVGASHGNQRPEASNLPRQAPSWCTGGKSATTPASVNRGRYSASENNSSSCDSVNSSSVSVLSVANSHSSISGLSNRNSCGESSSTGTASKTSTLSQSPRHPGLSSPLNSPLPISTPNPGLTTCQGTVKSASSLASVKGSIPFPSQSFNTFESHQTNTPREMSNPLQRPYNDSSELAKKAKFDESSYYKDNPLLGLKRSCEAIEAYCSPPKEDKSDSRVDDDDEDVDDDDVDFNDSAVPKNDRPSPVTEEAGEGIGSTESSSSITNCDQTDDCKKEGNSPENKSSPNEIQTIGDQHQSHPIYNGDVSDNKYEVPRAQTVKQEPYLPVETSSLPPSTNDKREYLERPHVHNIRPQFEIGDIVWAQARGFPSWPGKVVDASEVGKSRADEGKRWVMWFGDHTFSQVEVDRLKTLSDGLRTLDDKSRKKKYKAKKTRIGLEQAISEALEALDMRERLRGRQARSKSKKKRLR